MSGFYDIVLNCRCNTCGKHYPRTTLCQCVYCNSTLEIVETDEFVSTDEIVSDDFSVVNSYIVENL